MRPHGRSCPSSYERRLANVGEAWALGRPNAESLLARIPERFAQVSGRELAFNAFISDPSGREIGQLIGKGNARKEVGAYLKDMFDF